MATPYRFQSWNSRMIDNSMIFFLSPANGRNQEWNIGFHGASQNRFVAVQLGKICM
jgi:hypothetical protein